MVRTCGAMWGQNIQWGNGLGIVVGVSDPGRLVKVTVLNRQEAGSRRFSLSGQQRLWRVETIESSDLFELGAQWTGVLTCAGTTQCWCCLGLRGINKDPAGRALRCGEIWKCKGPGQQSCWSKPPKGLLLLVPIWMTNWRLSKMYVMGLFLVEPMGPLFKFRVKI